MPFYLSLANFANGLIWAVYALLKFDINVLVNSLNLLFPVLSGLVSLVILLFFLLFFSSEKLPNGLGALSGLVQLILYGTYYKTTNWDEEPEKPAASVELSSTSRA